MIRQVRQAARKGSADTATAVAPTFGRRSKDGGVARAHVAARVRQRPTTSRVLCGSQLPSVPSVVAWFVGSDVGSTAGAQVQMPLRHRRFLRGEQRFAYPVRPRSPAFPRRPGPSRSGARGYPRTPGAKSAADRAAATAPSRLCSEIPGPPIFWTAMSSPRYRGVLSGRGFGHTPASSAGAMAGYKSAAPAFPSATPRQWRRSWSRRSPADDRASPGDPGPAVSGGLGQLVRCRHPP